MIRRALENLPNGSDALDKSYHNAMERIQGQEVGFQEVAKLVLSWIVCANRPLTTSELQHALAVEVGDSELGEDNLQEIEEMVSVCAGLVTVDEESDIIRLVHYTTQEYFERTQSLWFPDAQTTIATTCVTYLLFDAFKGGPCSTNEEFKARLRDNILYDYAARNWGHHVRASSTRMEDEILDLKVQEFLESKLQVSAAAQAMMAPKSNDVYWIYPGIAQNEFLGVQLAAYLGLKKAILALLDNGHHPDPKDKLHDRPLSLAAQNGHNVIVKLLLANDSVDPDFKDSPYGRTPLSYAAGNGHEAVVKLLLDKDSVDPDSKDLYYGQTPLSWAAENGHKEVVELMLTMNGVDPDCMEISYGQPPLSLAAKNGHEAVVKLLLANDGVDPDFKDKNGQTPLALAATNGHNEVVKLLLSENGVNPDSKDIKYGRTPLSWAAENRHEEEINLLLARDGIYLDSKDKWDQTTPSQAVGNAHKEIVKLLLAENGVEPDSKDTYYGRTPLSWAAENGHEEIVKLLLASDGVDPDSKDKHGKTPLLWAAAKGHKNVVNLLLPENGIDPDSKDIDYGRTPQ